MAPSYRRVSNKAKSYVQYISLGLDQTLFRPLEPAEQVIGVKVKQGLRAITNIAKQTAKQIFVRDFLLKIQARSEIGLLKIYGEQHKK